MAQYEQPVNQINFQKGEQPENKRIEEQFMYKYMEMRPEKKQQIQKDIEEANTGADDSDAAGEDAEMEKFVDEEMDREMKRMAQGAPGGMPDSDEEDVSIEMSDDEDGEEGEQGDFFAGEDDLQDVAIESDGDEDDDLEEDLFSQGDSEGDEPEDSEE